MTVIIAVIRGNCRSNYWVEILKTGRKAGGRQVVVSVTIVFLPSLPWFPISAYWFWWEKISEILSPLFPRSALTDVAFILKSYDRFRIFKLYLGSLVNDYYIKNLQFIFIRSSNHYYYCRSELLRGGIDIFGVWWVSLIYKCVRKIMKN